MPGVYVDSVFRHIEGYGLRNDVPLFLHCFSRSLPLRALLPSLPSPPSHASRSFRFASSAASGDMSLGAHHGAREA